MREGEIFLAALFFLIALLSVALIFTTGNPVWVFLFLAGLLLAFFH